MRAICKLDYGQFENNKSYNYSYTKDNKYHVDGQYGKTEFNKRQFDALFSLEKSKNQNKSFNF
jgi:hypothetical protein